MISPRLLLRPADGGGNAQRAIASMHRVLASIGWDELEGASDPSIRVDFAESDSPVAEVVLAIDARAECFVAAFNFDGRAPVATRGEVMRFATRANWELLAGNFEVDLESGAVRFRSSVAFTGGELPESTIRSVIGTSMGIAEAYADAIQDVMEGRCRADAALAKVWLEHGEEMCGHA